MENVPTAPAEAPQAPESVATPNTTETTAAPQMPDMHGFTSDQLADMKKFFDNNGGFDAIKSKISNPAPAPVAPTAPAESTQASAAPQMPQQPQYTPPEGSITPQEFLAQQYFQSLASEEKYANISQDIASGNVLKEMASFNIRPLNPDGSINNTMIRRYLDLKAQTVPAKTTGAEPGASNAPTVEYVEVGDTINNLDQAYQVISQDAQLKRQGLAGHPKIALAETFIKENLGKTN